MRTVYLYTVANLMVKLVFRLLCNHDNIKALKHSKSYGVGRVGGGDVRESDKLLKFEPKISAF